ncbi:uncharacterized protein LOC125225283 [Leguminivora glycinivorella]|uniref:uncharacterized protein LOC125225283 n=1 Tax=Leguminivora glycinivorella TaxID=1035111 RepID=UPI00200CB19F|nr:uncharacterized protein LOC125225283 [Leguminivora glycinivorella]
MAARSCLLVALAFTIESACSLQLLELRVPSHVARGARAALACRWQLAPHDVLYSVKWYKDGKEFFRHVPRDPEPRRRFPLPGVYVENSDSSGSNVTLGPAELATEGRYRCEVSGERPLFPTVSDHADMTVVVVPESGPALTGFRSRYRAGERVQAACAAGAARPAPALAWYVNGEPAPPAAVGPLARRVHLGLETVSLPLDFRVTEDHFRNNGLKVKCLATIESLYWRSNEESAVRARDNSYDTMELRPRADADADDGEPISGADADVGSIGAADAGKNGAYGWRVFGVVICICCVINVF